ncbi:hypothetical protein [uncultured Modestobacter sp.]|uniref:hypothetical protein n=1 Tax=uncultured Modestobacter sp. TaxID=380048 RepID=UPI0026389049|nr:hypothetical protein [uncultured Modestobacter sp.]
MPERRRPLLLTAEIGWLLVSTVLLAIAATQTDGWRAVWLVVLAVNAVVVGRRVAVMARRAGRAHP